MESTASVAGDDPREESGIRGINGDPALLAVERACGELRRGRAVAIDGASGAIVIMSVETLTARSLAAMAAMCRETLTLAVSARRARAMNLAGAGQDAMALRLPASVSLNHVSALSGLGASADPGSGPAVPCDAVLDAGGHSVHARPAAARRGGRSGARCGRFLAAARERR